DVVFGDPGDQKALFPLVNFFGDFHDLVGRFARAKDNLRKTLSQRAMSVHLGEAEIGDGGSLEALQDLFPADLAVTKTLEQGIGFVDRHGKKMSPNLRTVTREMVQELSRGRSQTTCTV